MLSRSPVNKLKEFGFNELGFNELNITLNNTT